MWDVFLSSASLFNHKTIILQSKLVECEIIKRLSSQSKTYFGTKDLTGRKINVQNVRSFSLELKTICQNVPMEVANKSSPVHVGKKYKKNESGGA